MKGKRHRRSPFARAIEHLHRVSAIGFEIDVGSVEARALTATGFVNRDPPVRVQCRIVNCAVWSSMMRPVGLLGSMMCALLLSACSVFGIRSGTEQASYAVIAQLSEDTEVRRYPARLVAETSVTAADEQAGRNKAFRTLFDYISGANQSRAKVAMTSPVETAAGPEKVAMTAPVETRVGASGAFTMRFFLPADYTLETAPQPTDPAVRIVEVAERTIAVLRFSGSRSPDTIARRSQALDEVLEGSAWRPDGEPVTMFYDPPWTIPALRRNEIAVPVVGG